MTGQCLLTPAGTLEANTDGPVPAGARRRAIDFVLSERLF